MKDHNRFNQVAKPQKWLAVFFLTCQRDVYLCDVTGHKWANFQLVHPCQNDLFDILSTEIQFWADLKNLLAFGKSSKI